MQPLIELDGLTKRFGPVRAVDGISLAVARGEVLGLLGPNGAGKSTTLRMLAGYVAPTAGTARVAGHDVVDRPLAAKRAMGYLPEGAPAYGDMTPVSFLDFCAGMRGLSSTRRRAAVAKVMADAGLTEVAHQPIETLSKGYRRRVGIAQAIVHDPPVLVLDEPTDGLDPNQKHAMRGLVLGMAAAKAIIVSTHILEEVEAVCTRAVIIARGRVVADTTPALLRRRSAWHGAVRLTLAPAEAPRARSALAGLAGLRELRDLEPSTDGAELLLVPADAGTPLLPAVDAALVAAGVMVLARTTEVGRLDDVFRSLTLDQAA